MTANNYLILVKHSLPEVVETVPAREWRLSENGKTRAGILAEQLLPYKPQVLIASTEPKAIETAEIVGRKLQLPVQVLDDLHEHDRSKVKYLSKDEFERAMDQFFAQPDTLVFGSESANEAHERFSVAVLSALSTHEDKTTIIVAHGTVISLFVSHLTGISAFQLWNELGLPSFVVLDMNSSTLVAKETFLEH